MRFRFHKALYATTEWMESIIEVEQEPQWAPSGQLFLGGSAPPHPFSRPSASKVPDLGLQVYRPRTCPEAMDPKQAHGLDFKVKALVLEPWACWEPMALGFDWGP